MSQRVQNFPGRLLSAARVAAGLDTRGLAAAAKISTATLAKLEGSDAISLSDRKRHGHTERSVWERIVNALAERGIELLPAGPRHGPGIRLNPAGASPMSFASALAAYRTAAVDVAALTGGEIDNLDGQDADAALDLALAAQRRAVDALLAAPAEGPEDARALLAIGLNRLKDAGGAGEGADDAADVALLEKALAALGR